MIGTIVFYWALTGAVLSIPCCIYEAWVMNMHGSRKEVMGTDGPRKGLAAGLLFCACWLLAWPYLLYIITRGCLHPDKLSGVEWLHMRRQQKLKAKQDRIVATVKQLTGEDLPPEAAADKLDAMRVLEIPMTLKWVSPGDLGLRLPGVEAKALVATYFNRNPNKLLQEPTHIIIRMTDAPFQPVGAWRVTKDRADPGCGMPDRFFPDFEQAKAWCMGDSRWLKWRNPGDQLAILLLDREGQSEQLHADLNAVRKVRGRQLQDLFAQAADLLEKAPEDEARVVIRAGGVQIVTKLGGDTE